MSENRSEGLLRKAFVDKNCELTSCRIRPHCIEGGRVCAASCQLRQKNDEFIHGIVVALDYVAIHGDSTCFKEIVESAGMKDVLKEIKKNGLERTKKLAKQEFK